MTADILRENIDRYLGADARKDWVVDNDLYGSELGIIARHFPPAPAKILDLGCGGGRSTIGLEARGYDVDAIDLAQDLVEEAQKRVVKSRVQHMDARDLAFEDSSFDAALFSFNGLDCVHPSQERLRVLAEVHRVLKPGGVFYYSGHNGLAAWAPRPGDTLRKTIRRNRDLLLAQRRSFTERTRYLAYPERSGSQVLYSALPPVHFREQRETGFLPLAMYASRSYRQGITDSITDEPASWRHVGRLARLALTCPHLHYVAQKLAD